MTMQPVKIVKGLKDRRMQRALLQFFKPENYRRYCDSVPVHLLSIFKADFQDPSYLNQADRKRWNTCSMCMRLACCCAEMSTRVSRVMATSR